MDRISVIGGVVDRRYLEGQPNPTEAFDLTRRPWRPWMERLVVARETQIAFTIT